MAVVNFMAEALHTDKAPKAKLSDRGVRGRKTESGQSLIVAIIVLFLLLVLGAAFIAMIANNLRNARTAVRRLSGDAYAEAGIRYLDQQLSTSPEGADWRPVPACLPGGTAAIPDYTVCSAANPISQNDPDWQWLRPYNPATGVGGYARVNFGGDTLLSSGAATPPGSAGGRALVRVIYQPLRNTGAGQYANAVTGAADTADAEVSRYIGLESIGRVGIVDPMDPTTFANSEGANLAREIAAYKQIGLTDYLRYITNKDNKPSQAVLGSPLQVQDETIPTTGGGNAATFGIQTRDIPSFYVGPVRSNAPLTFYGVNQFYLDSQRGDALNVSGPISLANIDPTTTEALYHTTYDNGGTTIAGDPARVTVTDLSGVYSFLNNENYVLPSTSPYFSTFGGLVRDNPNGGDTARLDVTGVATNGANGQPLPDNSYAAAGVTVPTSPNLRSVPQAVAPVLDSQTTSGVTRYRALTRDSAPMALTDAGGTAPASALGPTPGLYGWGQNLYLNNGDDVQRQTGLGLLNSGYSLRSEWLNPNAGQSSSFWRHDSVYVPPGITITLTPRYMVMTRSGDTANLGSTYQDRYRFTRQDGSTVDETSVVRYSYLNDGTLNLAPFSASTTSVAGYNVETQDKLAGYPVTNKDDQGNKLPYYQGDMVIYAEGNIRIRGVVGGKDGDTGAYFLRHLTVVSGATIYVDGNLLRDNITASDTNPGATAIKGQSSIALLAHDYVCVNTTQFTGPLSGFTPGSEPAIDDPYSPYAIQLGTGSNSTGDLQYEFRLDVGPLDDVNTSPYDTTNVAGYYPSGGPSLYLRHGVESNTAGGQTAINLFINQSLSNNPPPPPATPTPNEFDFSVNPDVGLNQYDKNSLVLNNPNADTSAVLSDQVIPIGQANADFLFNGNAAPNGNSYPYANTPVPALGTTNEVTLNLDLSATNITNPQPYLVSRIAAAPMDVRVEAIMYAQEGSFFIIPGPWLNPDPSDTLTDYLQPDPNNPGQQLKTRPGDSANGSLITPQFPFYGQPQDVRLTFYGAITENMPADPSDQGAWLEKWGWIPNYQGSNQSFTVHGPLTTATVKDPSGATTPLDELSLHLYGTTVAGQVIGAGSYPVGGIVYEYDPRASSPYFPVGSTQQGAPLRPDPNYLGSFVPANQRPALPLTPRLPVAPGLLYEGERPVDASS